MALDVEGRQPGLPGSALEAAEALAALSETDPERAELAGPRVLARAQAERDPLAEVAVLGALGVAAREAGVLAVAVARFRRALRLAERAGDAALAARCRLDLASALAARGNGRAALQEIERAAPALRGLDLARLHVFRANVVGLLHGRLEEALHDYGKALAAFRRAGDPSREAKVLNNRGMLHAHRGALGEAKADLERAERIHSELGLERLAAQNRQNLGLIASWGGDLPRALTWFHQADEYFRRSGSIDPVGLRDRCEALLAGRLAPEARETAGRAVEELRRRGSERYLPEALLMVAEAALLEGDAAAARSAATEARRMFLRQRRRPWAALAAYTAVRAAPAGDSAGLLRDARRAAGALEEAGWAAAALDARLIAARVALDLGRPATARQDLATARRARERGPAALRVRAWHAEALLRLSSGDRRGAEMALRSGLRVLEGYRAALGATELRVHASGHAAELARLGLRLALARGEAEPVLRWAERWRAGSLLLRPARPPGGREVAAALAELRQVVREFDEAVVAGRDTSRLLRHQAALEETVRRATRQTRGTVAEPAQALPVGELQSRMGGGALLEIVEDEGRLHAVVLTAETRPTLHALADIGSVAAEVEGLRFALRRLALRHGSAASLAAASEAAAHASRRLDEMLLAPVAPRIGDGPLVVVPPGDLHALPWAALPSCDGRATTVVPSAALWLRAARGRRRAAPWERVLLAAGPGLRGAASEVRALTRLYPGAVWLAGKAATAAAVAAGLAGADLAHIAAHGRFRADNPLFSALQMADGALTVYDLEVLPRGPDVLVLSACESGLSGVSPGDEIMGLAAALFALGTRTLVASVVPVPDDSTRPLMLAFHAALTTGGSPSAALAAAQAKRRARGDALAAGFVCLGAGW